MKGSRPVWKLAISLICGFVLSFTSRMCLAEDYRSWTEADLYASSVSGIEKGKSLEKSIAMLSVLVTRKPKVSTYRLALGCAAAARLASLTYAEGNVNLVPAVNGISAKRLKIWEQMRDNPDLPLYGTPRPIKPAAPHTPDDDKPFDEPATVTDKQRSKLAAQSLVNLREAYRLSRTLPLEKRVETDYLCGWAMLEVYRYASELIHYRATPLPTKAKTKEKPTDQPTAETKPEEERDELLLEQKEIVAYFEECTIFDKKRADYWQSLAFAYAPTSLSASLKLFSTTLDDRENFANSSLQNNLEAANRCFRRALDLKHDDPDLLYQVALLNRVAKPEIALIYLTKLASSSINALFHYLIAQTHFDRMETLGAKIVPKSDPNARAKTDAEILKEREAAFSALEAGNNAADYRMVTLVLPVPRRLSVSWNYRPTYSNGQDFHLLQSIADSLRGLRELAVETKDAALMVRVLPLAVRIGMNALKHYVGNDLDPMEPMTPLLLHERASYGMFLLVNGNRFLEELTKLAPDDETTLTLIKQYTGLKDYYRAWDKALFP